MVNLPLQWFNDSTEHPPGLRRWKKCDGGRHVRVVAITMSKRSSWRSTNMPTPPLAIANYPGADQIARDLMANATSGGSWTSDLSLVRQGKGKARNKPGTEASTAFKTPLQQPQIAQ